MRDGRTRADIRPKAGDDAPLDIGSRKGLLRVR
jgi:hypothetical protein